MSVNPIVILGGGISGLSCAYYLHKFAGPLIAPRKIIVIEGSKHLGGWIKTKAFDDGVIHEIGPKSIRCMGAAGFNTLSLVNEIGLANEILGMPFTAPQEHKRYILHNKKLVELPSKFSQVIKKVPPFQHRLIKYLIHDLGTKKLDLEQHGGDISIYDFMTYRFGEEIAKYFFDPMCRGITAGDSKKLSMISVFPDTFRGEQTHGSVIKGAFGPKGDHNNYMDSELVRFAVQQKWSVWTFKQGLQYLPDGLCNYMINIQDNPIEIYNQSKVERLDFDSESNIASVYIKNSDNEEITIESDFIFSALPSRSLGKILSATKYPKLCEILNEISSANVAVVNLEFNGKLITDKPGFGFLAPSSEQSKILGVVFDSHTFPNFDADKDITRLTCMLGGEWFEELFGSVDSANENEILSVAIEAVREYLDIKSDPIRYLINIEKNCIPQYYLGHSKRLQAIDSEIKQNKFNINLIGASYNGISINDCIFNAKLAAQNFSKSISTF